VASDSGLVIRRLRPGDCEPLALLLQEAFAEEFQGGATDPVAVRRQLRSAAWAQGAGVRQMLTLLGSHFAYFVAAHRGRIIGSTAVSGSRLLVISSVAVHPGFRRLGVAAALVERAQTFALAAGREQVVLDVLAHNQPAVRLYEKLGYREYHRFRAYTLSALALQAAAPVPRGTWLEPLTPARVAAFSAVERAALPRRYFEVAPTLRDRYLRPRSLQWLDRIAGGVHAYRRVLVRDSRVAGYLLATAMPGHGEARIDYPLVVPDATSALSAALIDAVSFLQGAGRYAVRLDLSEDRPDQHAAAESLGFQHRWSFIQMVRRGA